MQLTDFCLQKALIFQQHPRVIIFQAKEYNNFAFRLIIEWLRLNNSIASDQKLDLELEISGLQKTLQTSFLGQYQTFWFGNVGLLSSKKKRQDWFEYLYYYQGPHQIIGFVTDDDGYKKSEHHLIVQIQDYYDSQSISKLDFLYSKNNSDQTAHFYGKLFRHQKQLSLEQICLLHSYAGLVGKNADLFFDEWLPYFVQQDVSLFYLAQLFFKKKAHLFFDQWLHIRLQYSDQFWTVFFSDQLFKAYFYVVLGGRIDQANKPLTFGLPFSFLKYDWKLFTLEQLQTAHQLLYVVDLELKNGGSLFALDNFFLQFFS